MKHFFVTCEYSQRAFRVAAILCVALFATQAARAQMKKAAVPSAIPTPLSQNDWRLDPYLFPVRAQIPAAPYHWFASTDAKHRNADYLLLKSGETRRIPLAAGNLLRLWSTSLFPDKTTLILQNKTRIPLIENGKARVGEMHEKAFALYPYSEFPPDGRAWAGAFPFEALDKLRVLAPNAALIVTNNAKEESKFFYQVAVAPRLESYDSSGRRNGNIENTDVVLAAGEEKAFWNASTRGAIGEIEIRFDAPPTDWNSLQLRATWDANEKQNAIDVPLGALVGNFYGNFSSGSSLWFFDGKTLVLRAEMPFGAGAKLSLLNTGNENLNASTRVSFVSTDKVSPLRFCARFGTAQTQKGEPLDLLAAPGSGAFLGFSLGVKPLPSSARLAFAYLEGNETIQADGRSYEGTGTEDFFNSAWYFPAKPFARPLHGLTFKQDIPPQVSAYRLMIPDAVPFEKNLRVVQEHGNRNNSDDLQYSWVAYWYQKTPLNFSIEESAPQAAATASESGAPKNSSPSETVVAGLGVILLGGAALILRWKMAPKKS